MSDDKKWLHMPRGELLDEMEVMEAELNRHRAFVDELKMVADRASLWVTPEVITELINKHGLGEQE